MTTQIAEYSATEAALAGLKEKFGSVVFDVTTKDGMKDAKAARNEVRSYRTALEAKRVEIKAPALERCRLIDSEAKRITSALEEIENPIAEQIAAEENRIKAEQEAKEAAFRAKVEAIQRNLADIRELPVKNFSATSERVQQVIDDLEGMKIDAENFGDFVADAEVLKAQTLATLRDMFNTKKTNEETEARLAAERAELERQRKEQAEREAESRRRIEEEERQARLKREEEERAARMAREEADRKARQEQEEREAKERKAREAAEAEERKKREAEEAARREAQRKENMKLDGREMLTAFVRLYGENEEFSEVTKAINSYFAKLPKAA